VVAWLSDERNTYENNSLSPLLWRLKDAKLFADVVAAVRKRGIFDMQAWGYGLLHRAEREIREWMASTPWVLQNTMPFARASLIETDQYSAGRTEIVEYWPLINARVHEIGDRPRVNNREAIATFASVAGYLFHTPTTLHTALDRLHLVCLLLLQDRNIEARDVFQLLAADIDAGRLDMRESIQYDYARAWLSFLDASDGNNLNAAREAAEKFKDYPVPHWKRLFAEVGRSVRQLDQLRHGLAALPSSEADDLTLEEGGEESSAAAQGAREARMAARASKEARLDFKLDAEAGKLRITHANLDTVTVGFHPLDLEIEFSSRPFAVSQAGQARAQEQPDASVSASNPALFVWPTESKSVFLPAGEEETSFDLPPSLRNRTLVVDVVGKGGEIVMSRVSGQSSMVIQVMERAGMVQVLAPSSSGYKPIASAYVKVYARLNDKSVVFYKDGYTDLLGRFDYASLSNTFVLQRSEKFAIFVADDGLGSTVREAGVPKT
jgi:hypothetical protein